jgi:hypothetical protein
LVHELKVDKELKDGVITGHGFTVQEYCVEGLTSHPLPLQLLRISMRLVPATAVTLDTDVAQVDQLVPLFVE